MRAVQFMLSDHVTLIDDNIGETPPEVSLRLMELAQFYSKCGLELSLLDAQGTWLPRLSSQSPRLPVCRAKSRTRKRSISGANVWPGLYRIGLALVAPTGRPSTRFAIDHPKLTSLRLAKLPLRTFAAMTVGVLGEDVHLCQEDDKACR